MLRRSFLRQATKSALTTKICWDQAPHCLKTRGFCCEKVDPSGGSKVSKLITELKGKPRKSTKVSIIGVGNVGQAVASFLLTRRLAQELVFVDVKKEWINGQALDFLHAAALLGDPKILTCIDGRKTKDSDFIIVTAGKTAKPAQNRLEVLEDSLNTLREIIPTVAELNKSAIFISVSNPSDVITWFLHKFGKIGRERCFTTGCHLDSIRFKYYIAQKLKIAPSAVDAYVIGEHGSSAVPVWSSVCVGGASLMRLNKKIGQDDDPDGFNKINELVKNSGKMVKEGKGYTNWAVGMSVIDCIEAVQANNGRILCVGTDMQGTNGIKDSVVLSMPCVMSSQGISGILNLPLMDNEKELLKKSAEILLEAQCSVKL